VAYDRPSAKALTQEDKEGPVKFIWMLAVLLGGLAVQPPASEGDAKVTFTFDDAKAMYGCKVTSNWHSKKTSFRGAIRSDTNAKGKEKATVKQGEYDLYLGVHGRKLAKGHPSISGEVYEAVKASKVMGPKLRAAFASAYTKDASGSYVLTARKADDAFWQTRFALELWDRETDSICVGSKELTFRLGLVLEADGDVPVTYPEGGKQRSRKADLVHVHSSPDERSNGLSCLTIPEKDWSRFIAPFMTKHGKLDDWISHVGYGSKVGTVEVTAE
jgi:hypothetical protein